MNPMMSALFVSANQAQQRRRDRGRDRVAVGSAVRRPANQRRTR